MESAAYKQGTRTRQPRAVNGALQDIEGANRDKYRCWRGLSQLICRETAKNPRRLALLCHLVSCSAALGKVGGRSPR